MNTKSMEDRTETYVAGFLWAVAADHVRAAREYRETYPNALGSHPALAAIVFAAMAAEAYINEASHYISSMSGLSPVPNQDKNAQGIFDAGAVTAQLEEDKVSTIVKYMVMSAMLPGESLRKGVAPLQDLQTLFLIRNDLLHPRIRKTPKYIHAFRQMGLTLTTEQTTPPIAGWVNQLQTPAIGRWACIAALRAIDHMNGQLSNTASSSYDAVRQTFNFITSSWDRLRESDDRLVIE